MENISLVKPCLITNKEFEFINNNNKIIVRKTTMVLIISLKHKDTNINIICGFDAI